MLTAEQKAGRIGKITSSVAAACLGLDERMSEIDAWLQIRGEAPDLASVKAIERGNRLEQVILEYPAEKLGLSMTHAPFRQVAPWTGDSCDALYWSSVDGGELLGPYDDLVAIGEGKSASLAIGREYGEEGTDEVPHHTLVQAHWHLIHWPEVDLCYVPVLVGGYRFEFRTYEVHRDKEFEGLMLEDLERWHRDYIIGDKMPPVGARDTGWLTSRFPRALQGALADTPEIEQAAKEKLLAAKDKKVAEEAEERAKNILRSLLGEHDGVVASWGKISWINNKASNVIDWAAVARAVAAQAKLTDEDLAVVVADHTTEKPGPRLLRVTPSKETKQQLGL